MKVREEANLVRQGGVLAVLAGLWSILVGLGITLRHAFSPPVTVQYPEEKKPVMPGFRGTLALLSDDQGRLKCTACGLCARTCPTGVIQVTGKTGEDGKKHVATYTADIGRCIVCGLCTEVCPFGALAMSPEYELAVYDPADLVLETEDLAALGRKLQEGEGTARIEQGKEEAR